MTSNIRDFDVDKTLIDKRAESWQDRKGERLIAVTGSGD